MDINGKKLPQVLPRARKHANSWSHAFGSSFLIQSRTPIKFYLIHPISYKRTLSIRFMSEKVLSACPVYVNHSKAKCVIDNF
jgi:hypothetical protein